MVDERERINQAKQGDKAAFEKLVITYKPALEKFSYQFGMAPDDISSVVQQTFLKAYEQLDRFEPESFQGGLYKIAIDVHRKFYKKKDREEKSHTSAYYFESDAHLLLHQSIHKLEEKYRLPLILFYFHEQTEEETARILKTKPSTVNSRLQKSREQLENPDEELFYGLKENYQLLPEYTDTEKMMHELPVKKQKKRRWQLIPIAAIIIGFFVFFMFALPEVDQTEHAEKSAEKTDANDNENTERNEEAEESSDELKVYVEEKKEEFRKELGLHSLEDLSAVDHVERLLADREGLNLSDEELYRMIDESLTTPNQKIEALNQARGDEREWAWQMVLGIYYNLEWSFSDYLQNLVNDFPLDASEQAKILDDQYNYNGPIEIVEILSAIHSQGYKLVKSHDMLEARIDYQYLAEQIEYPEGEEGIKRLFTFISEKMDVNYHRYTSEPTDVPWYEFDEILLGMEEIYLNHPEIHEFIIHYTGTMQAVSNYLHAYMIGGNQTSPSVVEDQLLAELRHFEENYPDSVFEPVISRRLEKYEAEGVEEPPLEQSTQDAQFLFNNVESNLSFDTFYDLYSWPITEGTARTFRNYTNMENENALADLTAYETLSLYIYAHEQGHELSELLYTGEGDASSVDWFSVFEFASLVLEEEADDGTFEFTFINMHQPVFKNTVVATMTLQHNGEGWKVIAQEEKDVPEIRNSY